MRICLLGFGEVGVMLADDLPEHGVITAYDPLFDNPSSKPSLASKARSAIVARRADDAAQNAELIISAVTASQTVAAAASVASSLTPGAYFLDLNSASPVAKKEAALAIEPCGGRYVEAAVMAPVAPKRLGTPLLLGGPHAEQFASVAQRLGFSNAQAYAPEVGRAAAAKLCRSVVVKGMEALLIESLLSARHYGVEDDVIASLSNMFPGPDWRALSSYMISRAIEHGVRRAEEMREAARTVADAGLTPLLSDAIAARQDWAAQTLAGLSDADLNTLYEALHGAKEQT